MQLSWQHFVGGIGLVFAAMIAWFGALWLNLQGANLWVFRICVFILLALAVLAVVWWLRNRQQAKPSGEASSRPEGAPSAGAAEDILLILREAEARVASSSQLPRGTRLSSLPVIFLVGDGGAGKTSVATQSGLEPELLSGQVYQEGNVAPTRLANLWFARKAVFVEMGGKTLGDANLWTRLLHRLAPSKLKSIFSGKPAAPRAAVVCYDCEKLAKAAGAEEITAQSRAIRARLEQISQTLGIHFPVYVLFTHADRLPYFDNFFRNLSDSEITQVLGVTLPPLTASATGVYAEQETKRLTSAFNSMFFSLAECRPGLLYRERNADKLSGIYEFPRELQKRITIATQFLVDLCRPSHLRSSAFLRGFYFTGIRLVEAAAPLGGTVIASKTSIAPARSFSANATSIMRADDFTKTQTQGWQTATQNVLAGESKKATQWLFLSHIFSHVILQDRAALGASGSSSRANVLKRVLLATAGVFAAIWVLGMIISFFGNRSLQEEVLAAANGIVPVRSQGPSMASIEDLQRLDAARQQLEKLAAFERSHKPLHLRWGLYSGADLFTSLRSLYFSRFHALLFGNVQTALVNSLRSLPSKPGLSDDPGSAYETLKAYLITTSNPEKSTREFLTPVLMKRWESAGDVGDDRRNLARAQFDFYADELLIGNPLPSEGDSFAVLQARTFLKLSSGVQPVYQAMLSAARKQTSGSSLNFSQKYPEASDVLRDPKIVGGEFTKTGWAFMDNAIAHPEKYLTGEDWVYGTAGGTHSSAVMNPAEIRALYQSDYIKQWREFLAAATPLPMGPYKEKARKLGKLSGNRSPLLALLCEVSQNTNVNSADVLKAFQPAQKVVAGQCLEHLVQESNQKYVAALIQVQTCLEGIQDSLPADQKDAAVNNCNTFSVQARVSAAEIAQGFNIDQEAKLDVKVKQLLEAPTSAAPPPSGGEGPKGVHEFCVALRNLGSKFPFDANSHLDASLADLTGFFQPGTGALSRFLELNKTVFTLEGGQYVQKVGKINFGPVITQAASIQRALYPNNSGQLQFQFALKARVPAGETSESVAIDGQEMKLTGTATNTKTFTWSGSLTGATLTLSGKTYSQFPGSWGAFKLFYQYTWTRTPAGFQLAWPVPGQGGQIVQYNGKNEVVEFELETASVPLFQRGYIAGLRCPPGAK